MASNISQERPDWLTEDEIRDLRNEVKKGSKPYTDEEIEAMEYDDPAFSISRANAKIALDILTEYGIPLTDEENTTE